MYIERGTGNEIQLASPAIPIKIMYKTFTEDLPEGEYFHTEMGTVRRIVTCKTIYFKTTSDAELFIDRMHTLNAAGGMNLEIRVSSAAMPGSLFNFISGKYTMKVACLEISNFLKIAYGDGTVWKCGQCKFRQIAAFV